MNVAQIVMCIAVTILVCTMNCTIDEIGCKKKKQFLHMISCRVLNIFVLVSHSFNYFILMYTGEPIYRTRDKEISVTVFVHECSGI